MNNLSEDILMRYLTGECSDEDFARVNAWIKESDDNARRLFRMEEVYHLGRHDSFPDQKKVARAEARLYKKLAQEDAHSRKVIRMHQWMRYAAIIVLALMIGTGGGYLYYQADPTRNMLTASSTDGKAILVSGMPSCLPSRKKVSHTGTSVPIPGSCMIQGSTPRSLQVY